MSCSSCHQKHYAPTGARCPYQPGDDIPAHLLPGSEELFSADPTESESPSEDETHAQQDGQLMQESLSDSDCEIPSAKTTPAKPPPMGPTSDAAPITLQQYADTTSDRVQHLEQERESLLEMQVTLHTQQRHLEAALADMQQQLQSGQLRPNPDVRRKLRQPATQTSIVTQQP